LDLVRDEADARLAPALPRERGGVRAPAHPEDRPHRRGALRGGVPGLSEAAPAGAPRRHLRAADPARSGVTWRRWSWGRGKLTSGTCGATRCMIRRSWPNITR